jgi:putative N6-adenine-specific DNA methylase
VRTGLPLYAVVAPGLEPFAAQELVALGLTPTHQESGGLAFAGSEEDLVRANLWLRTASRVLLRLGEFHARALGELERKAGLLPWQDWLPPETPLLVRATCRKSRLYHQRAVAERILAAAGAPGAIAADDATDEPTNGQRVVVRLYRDQCLISLDSSGELLHRRGYRLASGKAPLRETLAAALLAASGWDPGTPLVDPFAGSGTIPIEAALLARRLPPGLRRGFSFERWRGLDPSLLPRLRAEAEAGALSQTPAVILAADRDAGAVASARENAERAGVAQDIEFRQEALSHLRPPTVDGAVVSNPPYGVRVSEGKPLRDLFARLGQVARDRLAGWRMTLLLPADPLERATGLRFHESFRAQSGGLRVRALTTLIPPTQEPARPRSVDAPGTPS